MTYPGMGMNQGEQYSKWEYSEDDKNGRKRTKPEFREK